MNDLVSGGDAGRQLVFADSTILCLEMIENAAGSEDPKAAACKDNEMDQILASTEIAQLMWTAQSFTRAAQGTWSAVTHSLADLVGEANCGTMGALSSIGWGGNSKCSFAPVLKEDVQEHLSQYSGTMKVSFATCSAQVAAGAAAESSGTFQYRFNADPWGSFGDDAGKMPTPGREAGMEHEYSWSYSGQSFESLELRHSPSEDWHVCDLRIDCGTPPTDTLRMTKALPFTIDDSTIGTVSVVGSRWNHELAAASVDCGPWKVLTQLNATSEGLQYRGAVVAGLGACIPQFSSQVDFKGNRRFGSQQYANHLPRGEPHRQLPI